MKRIWMPVGICALTLMAGCSENPRIPELEAEPISEVDPVEQYAPDNQPTSPVAPPRPRPAVEESKHWAAGRIASDAGMVRHPELDWNHGLTQDRENYANLSGNPILRVADKPVSTFSIDVDTASYSNVRRMLNSGQLPPSDAVRIEEFINYFDYAYAGPVNDDAPFSVHTEIGPTPWNPDTQLLHLGIKGYQPEHRGASNLVFLVDVSGSMQSADKLELLKNALILLSNRLEDTDRVSIVVYAGASGVVLEPTPGNQHASIQTALKQLHAGGSTNGGSGIQLAYAKARESFIQGGINRVILATDGDFNVGTVNFESLLDLVRRERESGVALTTLGFGRGNLNDHLLEQLADNGNGNYFYVDTLAEAQKVLVDDLAATLMTIAKDVKIQIEFNPQVVSEYRLIGYENRMLKREDFNNDRVDAGDIGAGHTVTALYEIALNGSSGNRIDPLRYQSDSTPDQDMGSDELGFLKLRYKLPGEQKSRLIQQPILRSEMLADLENTSDRFRFSAAVAAFAQVLRGDPYLNEFDLNAALDLARSSRGEDYWGYRGEMLSLMRIANSLNNPLASHQQAPGMD